ncbi:hypothetical protein OROGR_010967 [Orobanche gracilis]
MVRLLVGSETSSFIYEDPGLIYMLGIIVLSISTVSLLIFICGQNDPAEGRPSTTLVIMAFLEMSLTELHPLVVIRTVISVRTKKEKAAIKKESKKKLKEDKKKRKLQLKTQDERHSRPPNADSANDEPPTAWDGLSDAYSDALRAGDSSFFD